MKNQEKKSQPISQEMVHRAYDQVRGNGQGAGIDGVSLKSFAEDCENQLYKLWNRLSSGSYFPPPVRTVPIPKAGKGQRILGIPTVLDRVAQMVVKQEIEPRLEAIFDEDSYGYRPGRSAHKAIAKCRERCFSQAWVIDLDIQGFFDQISHDLLRKALAKHVEEKWILMYIDRWLEAGMESDRGEKSQRNRGTPQGGVVSPLLANLFLHYVFDKWMDKNYANNKFERYADDVIIHCGTKAEAELLLAAIASRMNDCQLSLHPDKTQIVHCKMNNRRSEGQVQSFTFLGYDFQPRLARKSNGKLFLTFSPAVGKGAKQRLIKKFKARAQLHLTQIKVEQIAASINPLLRGWINYFSRFRRSAMRTALKKVDELLLKWARKKYKKLKTSQARAREWLRAVYQSRPKLFAHWAAGFQP